MNYKLKLLDNKGLEIDSVILSDCVDRLDALKRTKELLTLQGLRISTHKISLKEHKL